MTCCVINCLSDRQHYFKDFFNGELFDWNMILVNVPQGLYFRSFCVIIINDLSTVIKNFVFEFMMLSCTASSHPDLGVKECLLQSDLNIVMYWLCSSQISL